MTTMARYRWTLWPPIIFVVIVSSFLAATALGQWRVATLDDSIIELADTSGTSVQALAGARGEIRNLQVALREKPRPVLEPIVARMDQAIDEYLLLPIAPGEQKLWRAIIEGRSVLEEAMVPPVSTETVSASASSLDAALTRALEFNAARARELAADVRHVRRTALHTAVGLDVVSTIIAIAGALVLRRIARLHEGLLERHRQLEERRATELEQFAGRVAHDIMSPLGTVAFAFDLARKTEDAAERERLLDRGAAAVFRVKRMVTGLLEFARAGAKPDTDGRADVATVIADLAAELEPTATSAGVELSMTSAQGLTAACSPGVLTSMIANLTRNALKYIGDAEVRRVDVRALDRGAQVRVEVEDTGPGLAPDVESRVFDAYTRSRTAVQPGVGLGLATVKRLAEGHGGAVGVSSVSGKGCLFWFEMPKAKPATATASASASASAD